MLEKLEQIIEGSNNIVFFGGAGVSTESNIPDFRSPKGIYKTQKQYGISPEEMLGYTFFKNHTEEFYSFYKKNMIFTSAQPSPFTWPIRRRKAKSCNYPKYRWSTSRAGNREVLTSWFGV